MEFIDKPMLELTGIQQINAVIYVAGLVAIAWMILNIIAAISTKK